MLKALLKKQFMELFRSYFVNPKTGKKRPAKSLLGMFLLFAFLMLVCCFSFFSMGMALAEPLYEAGNGWLYFSLFGLLSTALGIFGSVFNTFASLYKAKDNDLVLSLPIKPSVILLSRMIPVYILSLLYGSLILIPTSICYWIFGEANLKLVVLPIILDLLLALFVSAITCILGWVVALISNKMKSKKIITVLFTFSFLAVYYYLSSQLGTFLMMISENSDAIGQIIKDKVSLYYIFGNAVYGNILHFIIFALISVVSFSLVVYVISKSFIKITTSSSKQTKKAYVQKTAKSNSITKALVTKEFKRFLSSTTYMMNCGLGLIIMPILAIALLIKKNDIFSLLGESFTEMSYILPVLAAGSLWLISSTIDITSPSISLEGKNIWITQSLPINPEIILKAKVYFQILISSPFLIITGTIIGIVFGANLIQCIFIVLSSIAFCSVSAQIGLILNLHFPNLNWTNETQPIKSSLPVFISLFGGWGISIILLGMYWLLSAVISTTVYLIVITIVICMIYIGLNKHIATKGVKLFKEL